MHMITMQLVGSRGTAGAPENLRELLAAHFDPADRIEHLWVGARPDRIDLVFFVIADCEAEALLAAHAACRRALDRTPRLTAWHMPDTGGGRLPL
ncbi:hypothetical protein OG625_40440 (plasmid) [Streptomyces sp. NBC_01351]|uniref:hypothetical protein n=1 Tax=Streptomyces sp. NBC_01351 TaxID=2903833 RepID=UPI002E2F3088|nr:hypothetical protein [Streptomyces sp. NBC_01351]